VTFGLKYVEQTLATDTIGASDAAAALGLVKWRSPMDVFRAIRDGRKDDTAGEAAEWGKLLEPVVRGKYALTKPAMVMVPVRSYVRDGWLRATPDGFVHEGAEPAVFEYDELFDDGRQAQEHAHGLVQIKTCSAWLGDEWDEWVPARYEVQVRVEMAVTGLPWCDVVCLVGGQRYVGPYRVLRDDALEQRIVTDLRTFWERANGGIPPEVDDSEAWRQYASEPMRKAEKVAIPADDDVRAFLVEWRQARTERKRAERQEEELKTQILLRLGAAGATKIDGGELGNVTAYPTPARFDWRGYAETLSAMFPKGAETIRRERFERPSKSWSLRAPSTWCDE